MPLSWFSQKPPLIEDAHWHTVVRGFPFAAHLSAADLARLRTMCSEFLRRKTVSGAGGFVVTPLVRTAIAFQACLPALNLGLAAYDDFVEIVVYPDQFLVPRSQVDEAGVVHESTELLAGEAMDRGPIVLSWADVAPGADTRDWNVTIHEFVHKIDLADGEADGVPPLPAARRERWRQALDEAYDAFCDTLDRVERSIPRDIDPEGSDADRWYRQLPLDPYAATDPAEFFAVCGEAFFVDPGPLAEAYPQFYHELAKFFGQDPLDANGLARRGDHAGD